MQRRSSCWRVLGGTAGSHYPHRTPRTRHRPASRPSHPPTHLAPIPSRSCTHDGQATLTLTSGDTKDPYAVCFPQLRVSVAYSAETKKCMLTITPDAMADSLKYGDATSANGAKVGGAGAALQPSCAGWLLGALGGVLTCRAA